MSQALPIQSTLIDPSVIYPAHGNVPSRVITTNCCAAWWNGLKTMHCTTCHHTFTTVTAFDKHRSGSHAYDTRHCTNPDKVGLIDAERAYPCWGLPSREQTE